MKPNNTSTDSTQTVIVLPPWLYDIAEENGWLTTGYQWVRLAKVSPSVPNS